MKVKHIASLALLWVVLAIPLSATAGTFTIPEWVEKSCVFVMNGEKAEGTGFVLGVKDHETTFFYFITAKHVIVPALKNARSLKLRLNLRDADKAKVVDFPLFNFSGKPWAEHHNPAIDIAVTPLALGDKLKKYDVQMITIDSPTNEFFACESFIKKYKVRPGDQAFALGLVPYLFSKDVKNLVMTRFGAISMVGTSELQLPGGKQKAHFLDCAAFGGQSGGPAFVLLERSESGALIAGWRIALLGVTTEFVPSPLRASKVTLAKQEKREAVVLIENTGISKVVPADYLVDILFSDTQKKFRRQIHKQQKKDSNKAMDSDKK